MIDNTRPEPRKSRKVSNAQRVAELRKAVLHSVTPVELAMLFRSILHEAKEEADLPCAKFITSYLIGMPQDADTMQQIEELKQAMAASERGY